MKKVIIMRGLPGSGKSTFGKSIADQAKLLGRSVAVCSADAYFYALGGGTYKFDPTKLGQAHASCFRTFTKALQANVQTIIVDNTNTSSMEISPYRLAVDSHNLDAEEEGRTEDMYDIDIKYINADPQTAVKRNSHGVSAQGIAMMHKRLQDPLPPWWKSETLTSKTDAEGKPLFEADIPPNSPEAEKVAAIRMVAKRMTKRLLTK